MADCPICGRPVGEELKNCPHCGARQDLNMTVEEAPMVDESGSEAEPQMPPQEPPKVRRGFGGILGIVLAKMNKKQKNVPVLVPILICGLLLGLALWITFSNTTDERMTAEETVSAFVDALQEQDAEALLKVVTRADNSVVLNEESVTPFMELYENAGDLSVLKTKLLDGESTNGAYLTQSGNDYSIMLTPIQVTIEVNLNSEGLRELGLLIVGEEDTCSVTVAGIEYPLKVYVPTVTIFVLPGRYQVMANYHNAVMNYDIGGGSSCGFMTDGASAELEVGTHYSAVVAAVPEEVTVESVTIDRCSGEGEIDEYPLDGENGGYIYEGNFRYLLIAPLNSGTEVVFTYTIDGVEYTKSCTAGQEGAAEQVVLGQTLSVTQKQEALSAVAQCFKDIYDALNAQDIDALDEMSHYTAADGTVFECSLCLAVDFGKGLYMTQDLPNQEINTCVVTAVTGDMAFAAEESDSDNGTAYGRTLVMVTDEILPPEGSDEETAGEMTCLYWAEIQLYQGEWIVTGLEEDTTDASISNPISIIDAG